MRSGSRRPFIVEVFHQVLHLLVGAGLVLLMGSPWAGLPVSIATGLGREALQHGWGTLDSRRRGMWMDLGFWFAGALGAALLFPNWAAADPIKFRPGDPFQLYLPGLVPPGIDSIKWCAVYKTPHEDTCVTHDAIPGQPIFPVSPATVADDYLEFDLVYRWIRDDGSETDPAYFFPPMMETYRADATSDGYVGGPDYLILLQESGSQ